MYSENIVKTNLNIDVLSIIESEKCSRVRILAASMAPITRIYRWDNFSNPLFEAVKRKCWIQPELRWLPYDELIKELISWIETKDVQWRIKMASCIPVIEKYDNSGLKVCQKMVNAYESIREKGSYTKIDYIESGEYFANLNAEKVAKKASPGKRKYWVVVSDADELNDALSLDDLWNMKLNNLQDEFGHKISFAPENEDFFIVQSKNSHKLIGAGLVKLDDYGIEDVNWIYEEEFRRISMPLIGDELLKPYLLRNKGCIHSIMDALADQEALRNDMEDMFQ